MTNQHVGAAPRWLQQHHGTLQIKREPNVTSVTQVFKRIKNYFTSNEFESKQLFFFFLHGEAFGSGFRIPGSGMRMTGFPDPT